MQIGSTRRRQAGACPTRLNEPYPKTGQIGKKILCALCKLRVRPFSKDFDPCRINQRRTYDGNIFPSIETAFCWDGKCSPPTNSVFSRSDMDVQLMVCVRFCSESSVRRFPPIARFVRVFAEIRGLFRSHFFVKRSRVDKTVWNDSE